MILNKGIIVKLICSFAAFTQYNVKELLNKTAEKVFRTLRIGPNINIGAEYFLLTREYETKFINILLIKKE